MWNNKRFFFQLRKCNGQLWWGNTAHTPEFYRSYHDKNKLWILMKLPSDKNKLI